MTRRNLPLSVCGWCALAALCAGAIVGCQHHDRDDDVQRHPPNQTIANDAKLDGLPDAVRQSFEREHGNTIVSNVEPLRSQGPPMYRISYIAGGHVSEVIYRYDGTQYIPPPQKPAPTAPLTH